MVCVELLCFKLFNTLRTNSELQRGSRNLNTEQKLTEPDRTSDPRVVAVKFMSRLSFLKVVSRAWVACASVVSRLRVLATPLLDTRSSVVQVIGLLSWYDSGSTGESFNYYCLKHHDLHRLTPRRWLESPLH